MPPKNVWDGNQHSCFGLHTVAFPGCYWKHQAMGFVLPYNLRSFLQNFWLCNFPVFAFVQQIFPTNLHRVKFLFLLQGCEEHSYIILFYEILTSMVMYSAGSSVTSDGHYPVQFMFCTTLDAMSIRCKVMLVGLISGTSDCGKSGRSYYLAFPKVRFRAVSFCALWLDYYFSWLTSLSIIFRSWRVQCRNIWCWAVVTFLCWPLN